MFLIGLWIAQHKDISNCHKRFTNHTQVSNSINMGIIQVKKMLQIQPENHFAIEIHVKFMEQVLKQNIIIKQYNPLIMFT